MVTMSIAARLTANGMQQHLYNEPAIVQEGTCQNPGEPCAWDSQCCPGNLCEWWHCTNI